VSAADLLTRRRTNRGPDLHDRNLLTPGYLDAPLDEMWWDGAAAGRGTLVVVGGSQTIVETAEPPRLTVSAISGIGNNAYNAVLFPRTISTGQTWACMVRNQTSNNAFLFGAIIFTDGVTAGSNVVTCSVYQNVDVTMQHLCHHGILSNASANTGAGAILGSAWFRRSPLRLTLTYVAANSFNARVDLWGGNEPRTTGNAAKTMTPTHVGVAWTNNGGSPTTPSLEFGPIYRTA
jgi:hypothetical protein